MKRTILLNGAIRDIEEFTLIVDHILQRKAQSQSDVGLVISTWHEDIAAHRGLFAWLAQQGVRVVGSPGLSEGGPANVYRQWRTLDAGLHYCDDDALILKGRTDKFLLRKDVINAFIEGRFHAQGLAQLQTQQRLAAEHVSLSLPFMAKDMIYLGTMQALREVTHFSLRTRYVADHIFNGIGPECFLWLEYARGDSDVQRIIAKTDLRQFSNAMLANESVTQADWSALSGHGALLYRRWLAIFDQRFAFLSDVLECDAAPSWVIDEGSWRYEIGDRAEFEMLRQQLTKATADSLEPLTALPYLNATSEVSFAPEEAIAPAFPFPQWREAMLTTTTRDYSDIVLLRKAIIEQELAKEAPDAARLSRALHWNIRQRDRTTLHMAYAWLMNDTPQKQYIAPADQYFVIERMVDFFTFQNDYESIGKTIDTLPQLFTGGDLKTRVAEHHFRHRRLFKALVWFIKANRVQPNHPGTLHGLGCTLLDMGMPRLALPHLKRVHALVPNDQTATFTLLRTYHASGQRKKALALLPQISGPLQSNAKELLHA